jgi:hypothetical protein
MSGNLGWCCRWFECANWFSSGHWHLRTVELDAFTLGIRGKAFKGELSKLKLIHPSVRQTNLQNAFAAEENDSSHRDEIGEAES